MLTTYLDVFSETKTRKGLGLIRSILMAERGARENHKSKLPVTQLEE